METSNVVWTIIAITILSAIVVAGLMRPRSADAPIDSLSLSDEDMTEESQPVLSVGDEEEADIEPMYNVVRATIKTNKGDIEIEMYGNEAPLTVGNFVKLAQDGFYDGTTFHRVIPNFVIQGGDPNSRDQENRDMHGAGGPGYKFQDEINERLIVSGSLAMANSGPNTNGSQFFIVTAEALAHLDGKHTNFGTVVSGMDIVNAISAVERDANDNPIDPVVIESIIIDEILELPEEEEILKEDDIIIDQE